jgi:hypothetical protein
MNVREAPSRSLAREEAEKRRRLVERGDAPHGTDDLREIERIEAGAAAEVGEVLPRAETGAPPKRVRFRLPGGVLLFEPLELAGVYADEVLVIHCVQR